CIRAARLTHLKFTDLVDNIPVMGEAEPYWKRVEGKDYSKKSKWLFPLNESNHNASMYCYHNNRSSICDWYEFHPCVIKAYNKLPLVRSLINDELPGKLSNWTSRISIHKEIWPYIENKIKLTGYEGSGFPGQQPDYMNRMQDYIISKIGTGTEYWLTDCELQFIF
ncbi:MAG: hypothetical protein EBV10_12215, partial [Synechococcaceae bacterium WB6_1A_059]|nr:hypothetical protein [Synechococcaceae bacterium WB6_1A_059]